MRNTILRNLLLSCLALALQPTLALADGRVDVEVKDTSGRLSSGQVTVSAGAISRTCSTVGGRCSVTVPAGAYQARAVAGSGASGSAQVAAPSTGSVRVVIVIQPPPAAPPVAATTEPSTTGSSGPTSTAPPPPPSPGATATTPPTTTTTTRSSATSRLRNLSTGRRLAVQGTVLDASGRLTNATVVLEIRGIAVGRATCVGGRFSMFDLRPGNYTVRAAGPNRTNVRVPVAFKGSLIKPTLRLPAR